MSGQELEIELTDPREDMGDLFEEISARVPSLERLAALGCGVPSMSLSEIVADTFARHMSLQDSMEGRSSCGSRAS